MQEGNVRPDYVWPGLDSMCVRGDIAVRFARHTAKIIVRFVCSLTEMTYRIVYARAIHPQLHIAQMRMHIVLK